MTVRFDTAATDKIQGASPAIASQAAFSWGFWFVVTGTVTDGNIAWVMDAADPYTAPCLSLEISDGDLSLFTVGLGSAPGPADIASGTHYYVVISRAAGGPYVKMRVFALDGTLLTDYDTGGDTSTQNYTGLNRGYGAIGGNSTIAGLEIESEKWELGVEWTDGQCQTERTKYALQRSGGTAEIQCDLTTVNADATGLNDVAGTAQNLTNSGAVTGSDHPSALETLGEMAQCAGTLVAGAVGGAATLSAEVAAGPFLTIQFRAA